MAFLEKLAVDSGACISSPFFLKQPAVPQLRHLSTRGWAFPSPLPPLCVAKRPPPLPTELPVDEERQQQRSFLVDAFHQRRCLKAFLSELSRSGSNPLCILDRDGDWPSDKLWPALTFLANSGRANEALQVFSLWKSKEVSRTNVANCSKIIRLFCEGNLMDAAMSVFEDMHKHDIAPSVTIYNAVIHGFARNAEFQKSRALLSRMMGDGLKPAPETYNGMLRAFGRCGLYDDMSKCVKMMESEGCYPNEVTYNLLISEFARGGLVQRMEKAYRTLLSKRMNLQSCTLITMLEAYVDLGILEKMEKMFRRFLNSEAFMKDDLIRKMANVYIENVRFARLEEFGNDIAGRTGRTELVWCILLLSSAGMMSRRGMDSLLCEMERAEVSFNTTFMNIFALFYLKMKDFKALDGVFSQANKQGAKLDLVTVSILFDACAIGYNGSYVLEKWKRNAFLESAVDMKTDPLVISAFGKGAFIRKCEKLYASLRSKAKDEKFWTYSDLIRLAFSRN
ncbi:Pentatricopeptide repeat-containing protein [Apostasia shenzhenica]|uniref:Pentatricopeptide repeat-containing protein n=1 Tax=Apostasia shenzhenica TaxID=1088818 RepID=A0A2H9ZS75_9ASPA|nr:Pentatricopeptide repeat-containing protein [Apostasia shenzhenica]